MKGERLGLYVSSTTLETGGPERNEKGKRSKRREFMCILFPGSHDMNFPVLSYFPITMNQNLELK